MNKKQRMLDAPSNVVTWSEVGNQAKIKYFAFLHAHATDDEYMDEGVVVESVVLPEECTKDHLREMFAFINDKDGLPIMHTIQNWWGPDRTAADAWRMVELIDYLGYEMQTIGFFVHAFFGIAPDEPMRYELMERWLRSDPFNYFRCRMFYEHRRYYTAKGAVVNIGTRVNALGNPSTHMMHLIREYINTCRSTWTLRDGVFFYRFGVNDMTVDPSVGGEEEYYIDPLLRAMYTQDDVMAFQMCKYSLWELISSTRVLNNWHASEPHGFSRGMFRRALRAKMRMLASWFEPDPNGRWKMTIDTVVGIFTVIKSDEWKWDMQNRTLYAVPGTNNAPTDLGMVYSLNQFLLDIMKLPSVAQSHHTRIRDCVVVDETGTAKVFRAETYNFARLN